jgi:hypothetical protein
MTGAMQLVVHEAAVPEWVQRVGIVELPVNRAQGHHGSLCRPRGSPLGAEGVAASKRAGLSGAAGGRMGLLAVALCPAAVQMTWSEVSLSSLTPTTTLSTDGSFTGAETTTRCTPHTSRYGLSAATCHTPTRRQHAVREGGGGAPCPGLGGARAVRPHCEELARAVDHDLHTHALPVNLHAHTAAGLRLTACCMRSMAFVCVLARGACVKSSELLNEIFWPSTVKWSSALSTFRGHVP